jgi:hypothetical protein
MRAVQHAKLMARRFVASLLIRVVTSHSSERATHPLGWGVLHYQARIVRRIADAVKVLGQKIVGTFHSHPVGVATPGKTDIEHALDDSLMFIFDCIGREGRLWKVKGRRARRMRFGFLSKAPSR